MLLFLFFRNIVLIVLNEKTHLLSSNIQNEAPRLLKPQRNFELLIYCPYEVYMNLYYIPKADLDTPMIIENKKDDENVKEIYDEKQHQFYHKQNLKNKKVNSQNGNTHVSDPDSYHICIIFIIFCLILFCNVVFAIYLVSDPSFLRITWLSWLFGILTWPLRWTYRKMKNIFTSKKQDTIENIELERTANVESI